VGVRVGGVAIGGTTVQFAVDTLVECKVIPTPASEDDLKALMFEMGVG
jgi:hypothetical protein